MMTSFRPGLIIGVFALVAVVVHAQQQSVPAHCCQAKEAIRQCNNNNVNTAGAQEACTEWCRKNMTPDGVDSGLIGGTCLKEDDMTDAACCCNGPEDVFVCSGDPHCRTPDNYYHHPQPHARVLLLRSRPDLDPTGEACDFKLLGEIKKPHPTYRVSLFTGLELHVFGHVINVTSGRLTEWYTGYQYPAVVNVDGQDVTQQLPLNIAEYDKRSKRLQIIAIYRVGPYVQVETSCGISFKIYAHIVYVSVAKLKPYIGLVEGWLGHYNKDGNRNNEFIYPDGTRSATPVAAENWPASLAFEDVSKGKGRAKVKNNDAKPDCVGQVKGQAKQFCGRYFDVNARNSIFSSCYSSGNQDIIEKAAGALESCEFEICALGVDETINNKESTLCALIEDIQSECHTAGYTSTKQWRNKKFCAAECDDPNASFSDCLSGNVQTCGATKFATKRGGGCVPGCECKPGFALNGSGKCVRKNSC